jgi:hypothetical protein
MARLLIADCQLLIANWRVNTLLTESAIGNRQLRSATPPFPFFNVLAETFECTDLLRGVALRLFR